MKKYSFLKSVLAFALVVICAISLCGCFNGPTGSAGRDGARVLSDVESYLQYLWDNQLVDTSKYADKDDFMVRYLVEVLYGSADDTQYGANVALQSAVDIHNITHGKAGAGVIYKLSKDNGEYTGDGYIITNYHVVCNTSTKTAATDVRVYLFGMTDYFQTSITTGTQTTTYDLRIGLKAKVIGFASGHDIAVLKIQGSDKTGATFKTKSGTIKTENYATAYGDTTKDVIRGAAVRPADIVSEKIGTGSRWEQAYGTKVIAVGNPNDWDMSVTTGVISVQSEYIEIEDMDGEFRVMRISTPIYSGNSGGGIFNNRGQLVGIVNARWDSTESYSTAYAIPLDTALPIATQFIYRLENEVVTTPMTLQVASFGDFDVLGYDTKTYYENGQLITEETVKVTSKGTSSLAVGTIINYMTVNGTEYRITKAYQVEDLLIEARTASKVTFS